MSKGGCAKFFLQRRECAGTGNPKTSKGVKEKKGREKTARGRIELTGRKS